MTANFDMVMSGPYSVTNCKSNTTPVVNLLNQLYTALQPVIADAKSQIPSPAYKAFFKDPASAPFVTTLLTNVTTGPPLTTPSLYSFNGGVSFMCVDDTDQFTFTLNGPRDAYTECQADTNRVSYYLAFNPPKPYVILCPSFFTTLQPVPSLRLCLTVSVYLNRFHGSGQALWRYQMWVLLSKILQYYLYVSTRTLDVAAATDVNKCFRLAADRSRLNAMNYVYYAASKAPLQLKDMSAESVWRVA